MGVRNMCTLHLAFTCRFSVRVAQPLSQYAPVEDVSAREAQLWGLAPAFALSPSTLQLELQVQNSASFLQKLQL